MIMKRLYRQYKWIAIFSVCLGLIGCLTSTDVRRIVEDSNTKLLDEALWKSRLITLNSDSEKIAIGGRPDPEEFKKLVNRIHEFIENNPDKSEIINPLRVRLGVLYISNGKPVLAETAFETVEVGPWLSQRDKFLKKYSDEFIWWYAKKKERFTDYDDKTEGLAFLKKVSAEELDSTEVRAFFEQVRANVADQVAQNMIKEESEIFRPVINGVIASYTEYWDPDHREDIKHIRKSMGQSCVTADFKTDFFLKPDEAAAIEKMVTETGVEIFKMYPTIFCTIETIQKHWRHVSSEPLQTPSWIKCTPLGDTIVCDGN